MARLRIGIVTAVYAMVWLINRWPAIESNALFYDDYAIPTGPAGFYVGSYRPLLLVEYVVWEWLVPGHFFTWLPKLTGALYLAGACCAFAILLERWQVPRAVALTVPLVVLCNPVLADPVLWQSLHALPLALLAIIAGHIAWTYNKPWLAAALLFTGALGYQIYLGLSLVLLAAEFALERINLRTMFRRSAVVAGVGVMQITLMLVTKLVLPKHDSRGFASTGSMPDFLLAKMHGVFDLTVNGIMPVLAWYTSGIHAMSLWKWIPIGLAALTAVSTRRIVPTFIVLILLFLPGLPGLIMSQSPYAWRVSAAVAFALALAILIPLVTVRSKALVVVVFLLFATLMAPVSWYEARMRAEGYRRQQRIADWIKNRHGENRILVGSTIVWSPPETPIVEDRRYIGSHELTWGYKIRTPGMWNSWGDDWMVGAYAGNYRKMHWRKANAHEQQRCRVNCTDGPFPSPRLMKLDGQAILLCPDVLPQPPLRCP